LSIEENRRKWQFRRVINSLEKWSDFCPCPLFNGLATFLEWRVWKTKASVEVESGCRFSGSLTFDN